MAGMTLSDATTDRDELTAQLDREYVFHSWSAQAGLDLPVIAGGLGTTVWDHAGNALPRLLQPARQRQHRAPASGRRRRDPGAGRPARDHRTGPREPRPRRGGAADPRAGARRASARSSSPTAAPTRTRTRSAWRVCTPGATRSSRRYRSYHGNTGAAIVATGRLATDAERVRPRARALLRPLPLPLASSGRRRPRRSPRARCTTCERVIQSEGPATIAAILLETDPGHGRHPGAAARATSPVSARSSTGTGSS